MDVDAVHWYAAYTWPGVQSLSRLPPLVQTDRRSLLVGPLPWGAALILALDGFDKS